MRRLLIVCLALTIAFIGCGKAAEKTQEAVIEHAIESGNKDADVDVDMKNGNMTTKSTEDGKTTTMNYTNDGGTMTISGQKGNTMIATGKSAKIPENFPKDIPQYPGAEIQSVMVNEEEGVSSLDTSTPDALDKVAAWMKDQIAKDGWTPDQSITMDGDSPMRMMTSKKESRELMVQIMSESGVTHIVCSQSKEN